MFLIISPEQTFESKLKMTMTLQTHLALCKMKMFALDGKMYIHYNGMITVNVTLFI